ncbi:MAG: hypothetical protein M1820_004219 [Bogoriella megaspora]|nr:MAG: hypothetical protein M1820_004219 [Bogoriella megaspora]
MAPQSPLSEKLGMPSSARSGTVFLITSDGKIISLPVPSNSRHDPLNWRPRKRIIALLAVAVYSWVGLLLPQGAGLATTGLQAEFGGHISKPFGIDTLISAPTFFMGIGTFIWIPMTLWLGRRPVFVTSALIMLFAAILAAFATNYYILLLAVSLIGLTEGFSLSAALLIIIDLTFIHQRPNAIAAVWSGIGFISECSLTTVPFLTQGGQDWRGFYKYWSFPAAISCLLVFFFFPETYYKRPAIAFDGRLIVQSAEEDVIIYDDHEEDFPEKMLPEDPDRSFRRKIFDLFTIQRASPGRWKAMFRCHVQVAFCSVNPLIFWVAILNAMSFAGMMFIGETFDMVLSKPPYQLHRNLIILVDVSAGLGSVLAGLVQGPLMTKLLRSLSMRNKGVREAEHYLVMFILPVLAGAASDILYGLTTQLHWHFAFVYLSYALNSFNFTGLAIANTLWVTEAFPQWAAPALVVVGGGSYVLSFGLSFVLIPWIQNQGMLKVGLQLGALQLALGLIVVPLSFWGKGARQYIHSRWGEGRDGALRPQ